MLAQQGPHFTDPWLLQTFASSRVEQDLQLADAQSTVPVCLPNCLWACSCYPKNLKMTLTSDFAGAVPRSDASITSSADLDSHAVAQIIRCLKNCPCRIHQGVARHDGIYLVGHHLQFSLDSNWKTSPLLIARPRRSASVPRTAPQRAHSTGVVPLACTGSATLIDRLPQSLHTILNPDRSRGVGEAVTLIGVP